MRCLSSRSDLVMGAGAGGFLPLKRRAGAAEGGEQHVGRHSLHAQLALLAGALFTALLAGDVGDIGLLQPVRRQDGLEVAADDEARARPGR